MHYDAPTDPASIQNSIKIRERRTTSTVIPFRISVDDDYDIFVDWGNVTMEQWSDDDGAGGTTDPYQYLVTERIRENTGIAIADGDTTGIWVRANMICDSSFTDVHACFAGVNLSDWTAHYPDFPTIVGSTTYNAEGDGFAFTRSNIGVTHYVYVYIGNVVRSGSDVTVTQSRRSDIDISSIAGFGTASSS